MSKNLINNLFIVYKSYKMIIKNDPFLRKKHKLCFSFLKITRHFSIIRFFKSFFKLLENVEKEIDFVLTQKLPELIRDKKLSILLEEKNIKKLSLEELFINKNKKINE